MRRLLFALLLTTCSSSCREVPPPSAHSQQGDTANAAGTPTQHPSGAPGATGEPRLAKPVPTNPTLGKAANEPRAPQPDAPAAPRLPSEAELEATRSALRSDLGDSIRLGTLHGVFVLAAPKSMSNATFTGSQRFVERVLDAYLNQRFDRLPEQPVKVLLFPNAASYGAYCKHHYGEPPSTPYGFYRPDERQITMNLGPGVGTLTHELVHPILDADFPAAPEWLNEGLASLFERPVLTRKGEIHGATNWRLPRLAKAIRSPRERSEASLSRLFTLKDAEFRGPNEDLYYALARYFCQWLDQRGELWSFYRLWRTDHAKDPSGELSFRKVTGKAPADFDQQFQRWALRL